MNPCRIFAVVLRQLYLLRNSMTRVVPLFIWVALDIVVWGFITRYLNAITGAGLNFVPLFLGAVLLWDFLVRVMQGVTMAFMEDSWSRNFLNMFASPLKITEYLSGLVISSIGTSLVGLIVMLLLATWIFGLSFFAYGMMLLPFLLVLFLSGIALGIVGSSIMLRFGPASEWFIWPIPAVVSPFVGVFYPVATLPHWMQAISRLLPPSYVFEGMRAIVAGHGVPPAALAIGFGLSLLYILLACLLFARIHRYAVKTGLIA
ncbi:MAG: ABC transporter permease, partial [Pseudomonadota bacterium]|nr:ABC transporter permease [Pseudomonadota bacterium]